MKGGSDALEAPGFTRSLSLYWGWRTQRLLSAKSGRGDDPADAHNDETAAAAAGPATSSRRLLPHARGRFGADARALRCEHWLEMADEKHRYGSNLLPYFEWWWRKRQGAAAAAAATAGEEEGATPPGGGSPPHHHRPPLALDAAERDAAARSFFAFLDGTPEGAALDLGATAEEEEGQQQQEGGGGGGGRIGAAGGGGGPPLLPSREKLERERVRYLSPRERAELEVGVDERGRLVYKRSGAPVHTRGGEQGRQQRRRVVERAAAEEEDGAGSSGAGGKQDGGEAAVARALAPFLSAAAPGEEDKEEQVAEEAEEEEGAEEDGGGGGGGGGGCGEAKYAKQKAEEDEQEEEGGGGGGDKTAVITNKPCKWIWVLDRQRRLYVHAKRRGAFHHSSFLEGGEVLSAGGLEADGGRVVRLTADSGHYKPSLDNFMATVSLLRDWGADLSGATLSAKHLAAPELLLPLPLPLLEPPLPAAAAATAATAAGDGDLHHLQPPQQRAAVPTLARGGGGARSLGALAATRFASSVLMESAVEAALAAERGLR